MISHESASKTNHKKVSSHSGTPLGVETSHGHLDSLNSPRPKLEGSHHFPSYSILCVRPRRLHSNGFLSWDSQSGVPKLSWSGLPRLWTTITSRPNLRSGRGFNQTCSPLQELSNVVSHFTCQRRIGVDFRLLMVESQTASLTPGPSFAHNLGCKCPTGSCEAILDIYTPRPFQRYKKHLNMRCFDPCNCLLNFWESRRTPTPIFGSVSGDLTLPSKWGCDKACRNFII